LQGHKEWLAEVQFLGVVDHPKLVKLLGYCAVDGDRVIQRLLVYEYMANKSLEDHLFGQKYPSLPWVTRLKIMLDAAEGLAYLHDGMEIHVSFPFTGFHFNLVGKSANFDEPIGFGCLLPSLFLGLLVLRSSHMPTCSIHMPLLAAKQCSYVSASVFLSGNIS